MGQQQQLSKDYLDETAILERRKDSTDMDVDLFAQIRGIRGTQFGKDVYTSILKFQDLGKFLAIFPQVQRGVSKLRVKDIKRYILNSLESEEESYMKFFNSITVTCRGNMIYDDAKGVVLIDTRSPMSINDGQHRVGGVNEAIAELEKTIEKTTDLNDRRIVEDKLEKLKNMIIPVVIYNGIDEEQEAQLFHDLNNLTRRPSRNANIRLSQTDLFAKMAKELSEENKYLAHYGVEMDKQSIFKSNENTFLLSAVYNSIRQLLNSNITHDRNFLKKKNYSRVKAEINQKLDSILFTLPSDMDTKGKYLIEKSFTIIGICKFYSYANDNLLFADKEDILKIIKNINWSYKNPDWLNYGGIKGKGSNVVFSATSAGVKGVYNYLVDESEKFLAKKEKSYIKE